MTGISLLLPPEGEIDGSVLMLFVRNEEGTDSGDRSGN